MTTDTPRIKDRRPSIPGAARASAMLRRHCRIIPFMHQADGLACMLDRFERFHSFGLLHDMGCGKTLTMLGALLTLHEDGRARTMLVVCPSSVIGAWEKECEGIIKRGGPTVDVLALTHPEVKRRKKQLSEWLLARRQAVQMGQDVAPGIVCLNYEASWRMEPELKAAGFDIEACDESQRIKAAGSRQSLAMYRIGQAKSSVAFDAWNAARAVSNRPPLTLAPYRVVMTGTPVPEGGLDWYGQFRFLDPTLFGTSHANFKRKYASEIDCGTFRKVVINQYALPELERLVMERVHRVSKEDAVDLPEQTHVQLLFEMAPKQRRLYEDLVRDSIAMIEERGVGQIGLAGEFDLGINGAEIVGDNVLTRMLRLQQLTGGYMQVDGRDSVEPCMVDSKGKITNPKLAVLKELMETLRDANAKLVIFHRFTHEGMAIVEACQAMSGKGTPVSVINGAVKTSDRKRMVEEFQEGDANFFVGQIQACAEGITLHAASDGAFYSSPFASAVFQQALARYHRIGQEHAVTHHHLNAIGTLDETVYASQMRKQADAFEHVDGGWGRFLRGGR